MVRLYRKLSTTKVFFVLSLTESNGEDGMLTKTSEERVSISACMANL